MWDEMCEEYVALFESGEDDERCIQLYEQILNKLIAECDNSINH